jgi:hypothetical protein
VIAGAMGLEGLVSGRLQDWAKVLNPAYQRVV